MRKLFVVSATLAIMGFGCATQRVYTQNQLTGSTPNYEKSQPFFISGIGQTQDTNAAEVCGNRPISKVETTQTFLDGFLGVITFGIYTPRTVQVYCK